MTRHYRRRDRSKHRRPFGDMIITKRQPSWSPKAMWRMPRLVKISTLVPWKRKQKPRGSTGRFWEF